MVPKDELERTEKEIKDAATRNKQLRN